MNFNIVDLKKGIWKTSFNKGIFSGCEKDTKLKEIHKTIQNGKDIICLDNHEHIVMFRIQTLN